MLIRLTNKCRMGCKHCMIDAASPDGEHMDKEVFFEAIEFALKIGSKVVVISGGEPFEHPSFFSLMGDLAFFKNHRKFRQTMFVVTSNGMFWDDQNKVVQAERMSIPIQVTNDPRYYPQKIDLDKFSNMTDVTVEDHIRSIFPCRRTREAGIEASCKAPKCFNLRSATRQIGLRNAVAMLQLKGKFCTPAVNIDGSIVVGEADTCTKIGMVTDDLSLIEENIKNVKCNRCGLRKSLSPMHLEAIGEK